MGGLEPSPSIAAASGAGSTEFGDADQILAAFTRQAPGRRAALALLATGPVFAACWGPSLIMSQAWAWPIPIAAEVAFGLALLGIVATLAIAATSHHNYGRTQLAAAGGIGLIVLDAAHADRRATGRAHHGLADGHRDPGQSRPDRLHRPISAAGSMSRSVNSTAPTYLRWALRRPAPEQLC